MADFKDRLRELRTEKGLTQQELGDAIGLHGMSISGYERGVKRPSFEALDNIADVLNVSIDYLLGRSDVNKGYPRHVSAAMPTPDPADDFDVMEQIGDDGLPIRAKKYYDGIIAAYNAASPDTQAAVRAILHVEEDPDGDR